jgi:hypothetical protein
VQEAGFATAVTPSFTAEDQELSLDKVPRGLKHFMLPARELPSRRAHGKQKSEWSSEARHLHSKEHLPWTLKNILGQRMSKRFFASFAFEI